jgi:S1-C subfamily serine protease
MLGRTHNMVKRNEGKWPVKMKSVLDFRKSGRYSHLIFFMTITVFLIVTTLPGIVSTMAQLSNEEKRASVANVSLFNLSAAEVFESVADSVVSITVLSKDEGMVGAGSGFVYDDNGHIITNEHVVDGADTYFVTFIDGNIYSANLVGADQYADLAVLKINSSAIADQKPMPVIIENSSEVRIGEEVIAVGNPLGSLGGSVSTGVVSQTNRAIAAGSPFQIPNAIQTDAAINPGNSGGPLFNTAAKVIGVNAAGTGPDPGSQANAGLNFAIPSNLVKKIVPQLIETGSYKHPWFGARAIAITPVTVSELGFQDVRGVVLRDILPGTPASNAGLVSGDIVTEADGKRVWTVEDLTTYVDEKSVGDTLTLKILRQGTSLDVPVSLVERPTQYILRESPPAQ